jgi:NAD(P)H-dependent FMN reductase
VPLYLPILFGTVREGRRSLALARYVEERLRTREDVTTRLVDPVDLPIENLRLRKWEMPDPDERIVAYSAEMERADGFVVVTPEYNYGIPGTLKNMLDVIFREWNRKPFGIVATGGIAGGARAADMLRQVIAGLRAVTVPRHVIVHDIENAFVNGRPKDEAALDALLQPFFADLEWYARALQHARRTWPAPA